MFDLAKVRYDKLSEENKPFFQIVVTLNTHFPTGICEDRIPMVDDNCINSAIRNQDMFIKDYIEHISKNPKYKDTIVLIIPDHLSMATSVAKEFEGTDRRLFYLINMPKEETGINTEDFFNYEYFPQKLLDLAGVESNSKLLSYLFRDGNRLTQEEINIITNELWGRIKNNR